MEYNIDYFIKKFKAIPEEDWCECGFTDRRGGRCAYGHCGQTSETKSTDESSALADIAIKHDGYASILARINDGELGDGDTPKERVLNYLKSLK